MPQNWLSWFLPSPRDTERAETHALLERVRHAQRSASLHTEDAISRFVTDLVIDICERRGVTPAAALATALYSAIHDLLHHDTIIGELPTAGDIETISLEEGVRLRAALHRAERFHAAQARLLPLWREKIAVLFSGILEYFPDSAFVDTDDDGETDDDSLVLPEAPAYELCERLPELITRIMRTMFDDDIEAAQLFEPIRAVFDENLYRASGIAPEDRDKRVRLILPSDSTIRDPAALVDAYLDGTAFQRFFAHPVPFVIPFPARFEHTHVVGGTGHGKTQLLQFLIHHDLMRSKADGRALVVLDSQGDLIHTVSHLGLWNDPAFRDRFVLVDPNDVEHPVCLNMFDWNRDRLSGYAPVDREKMLNATVELYGYFFGALLGAELTQRQGLIFRYLARLLMEIPDATVHTLRELMEDGEPFRPYMERLSGSARSFFATQFFDRKFGETKKQILTRLWGVLSNSSLERMFSHTENRIDLFELLNQGKIVLINTAKDLLGQEGSAIFGRFFIALIAQAAMQRAPMAPHTRRPAFVYIDEAQDYFDDTIGQLLAQARKYRLGLVLAHQNMDQLTPSLRASILTSTTIKLAGGLSAKDAALLDAEFHTTSAFLLSQQKRKHRTEFAAYIKNHTAQALTISIPLGYMESMPKLDAGAYRALIAQNRACYAAPPLALDETPFPKRAAPVSVRPEPKPAPPTAVAVRQPVPARLLPKPPPPPEPERGGRQHAYVQQLIKRLAEERGFRAIIEEPILNGAGRVDVSLTRGTEKIACQVSVTTTKDWELGGVEKCLAAGYAEVLLISQSARHLKTLSTFIEDNLVPAMQGRVRYLTVDALPDHFGNIAVPESSVRSVRGYTVRTTYQAVSAEEAKARRKAITGVIARSLQKGVE